MFTSKALKTVGLVWKPIRAKPTTKANTRKRAAKLRSVETLLAQHPLNKYRNTLYKRERLIQNAPVITAENFAVEAEKERISDLKIAVRKLKIKLQAETKAHKIQEASEARENSAAELIKQLQSSPKYAPYPTF